MAQIASVKVPAAAKPDKPLAPNAACITPACHVRYASNAHIHGPISALACNVCHQDDQGGHTYPLKRDRNGTCTYCHAVAGTKAHQHAALNTDTRVAATTPSSTGSGTAGGCLACHDPHGSRTKYLLTADNVEQLCTKCHVQPLKHFAHEPYAAGQCTLCHQPHQTDTAFLLRGGDGPEHCFMCHGDIKQRMAKATKAHKPAENCTTCHGAHTTDNPTQLKAPLNDGCLACHKKFQERLTAGGTPHGAILNGKGCANCHDPHAADQPGLAKDRSDRLCLTCHDKDLPAADGHTVPGMKEVLASANLHGPVKSGNCSDCHNPHSSRNASLLRYPFPKQFYAKFDLNNYALCFTCHDKQIVLAAQTANLTNFRDGAINLHFVHVNREDKGRTCKTCHAVHGSDLPKHMAAAVPFEGSAWPMPIRYEPAPDGGRCAPGCHEPLAYSRQKQLNPSPGTAKFPAPASTSAPAAETRGSP